MPQGNNNTNKVIPKSVNGYPLESQRPCTTLAKCINQSRQSDSLEWSKSIGVYLTV